MSAKQLTEVLNSEVLKERFVQTAPVGVQFESEKGFAVQLLQNNSWLKKVAEGSPNSLLQAVTNIAAIGLSLNPAKKQAYLITRNMKIDKNKWEQRIFLEPSYMGLCDLATSTGRIEWVQAYIVRANDTYLNKGPGEKPEHSYNSFGDRGEIIGAYCVAKTSGSDYLVSEMDVEKLNSIRDRSEAWKAGQKGPWKTDYEEMAKKSVIRQAFKTWPKTGLDKLEQAVSMSNDNEGFEPIQTAPEVSSFNVDQKEYFDQLITNNDALGIFVLRQTVDESIYTNLYHSFPKGEKGKYQSIVNSLQEKGRSTFEDYINIIIEACESGDNQALLEACEELSEEAIKLLEEKLNNEQRIQFINMVKENNG